MGLGAAREMSGPESPLEEALAQALEIPDERLLDERWAQAFAQARAFTLRPGKRVRPALLVSSFTAAGGRGGSEGVIRFAAGLELLHTFLLIHDDVADRADSRRGGPSLHRILGEGRGGEDLAIVVGDHLFARSFELMLGSGLPGSAAAAQYLLSICRHTAVGQFLDLQLSRVPVDQVSLFQTLKVAHLKTARYGFVAPLACGVILAEGAGPLRQTMERIGRHVGLAYQLRDDLIGLYGEERVSGKSSSSDYFEGKRTFPLVAALIRADEIGRRRLISLWEREDKDEVSLAAAREELRRYGGVDATLRAIQRSTRAARRALAALPETAGVRTQLDQLVARLAHRAA